MEKRTISTIMLYILSFIGDFNNSLITVGTIIYATLHGATPVEVGWIGAAYGLTYLFSPTLFGRLSEKISRKQSLLIGTFGQTLVALYLYFLGRTPLTFILGLMILGIVYGFFWPSVEALISEFSSQSPKSHQIGFFNFCVAWGFGIALGPWIGGYFSDFNIVLAFLGSVIIYLFGFCCVLFGLQVPKKEKVSDSPKTAEENKISSANLTLTDPESKASDNTVKIESVGVILIIILVNTFLGKMFNNYFPNYAARSDGLNLTGTIIGQVLLFYGLGRMIFFILGRFWELKFSFIVRSIFGLSLILIIIPWIRNPVIIAMFFVVAGFCIGCIYICSLEMLLKREKKEKGTKAGFFESFIGLGSSLAPVFAGGLATVNIFLPFYIFATLALTVSVLLWYLIHKQSKKN